MKLTQQEFDKLRPIKNWVIVKPIFTNKVKLGDTDIVIQSNLSTDEYKHTPRTGHIVKTNHDIPVGTFIWYDYLASMNALGTASHHSRMFFDVDGEIYIPIEYEEIYAYKSAQGTFSTKGRYIIAQHKEVVSSVLFIPETYDKKNKLATIMFNYVGADLNVGDVVHTGREWGVPLESDYYNELGEGLYIIREDKILGLYE